MHYSWNWSVLTVEPNFGWIISGIEWTILVSLTAWAIAFTLGSALRCRPHDAQPRRAGLAGAYVEIFRNVPLLVQMFLWYFVLPEVLPERWGTWLKRDLPDAEFWTAVVCLGLYTACRVCETVRSGIGSISRGQRYAGLATGLTPLQVYVHILLPVGYRIIMPALTTEFLSIFKNSSLALTIGVLELTGQTRRIAEYTFQPIEMFLTATALYGLITLTVTAAMRVVEERTRLTGTITVAVQ